MFNESSTKKKSEPIIEENLGFSNFKEIEQELFNALIEQDDSLLLLFSKKININLWTIMAFSKNNFNYRNIPSKLTYDIYISSSNNYYQQLLFIKNSLKQKGDLSYLKLIGFDYRNIGNTKSISQTEQPVIFKLNNEEIKIKLGELFFFDSKYKSFTLPKMI